MLNPKSSKFGLNNGSRNWCCLWSTTCVICNTECIAKLIWSKDIKTKGNQLISEIPSLCLTFTSVPSVLLVNFCCHVQPRTMILPRETISVAQWLLAGEEYCASRGIMWTPGVRRLLHEAFKTAVSIPTPRCYTIFFVFALQLGLVCNMYLSSNGGPGGCVNSTFPKCDNPFNRHCHSWHKKWTSRIFSRS